MLTGGGTAGHLIPFVPMIESLRTRFIEQQDKLPARVDPNELEIVFAGVVNQAAQDLFGQYDVKVTNIVSGKLRRYASWKNIVDLLVNLPLGIAKALVVVWRQMPDVIISKGGYGSVPVVLAAVFFRIPVLLHESDAVPGLSNRWLSRFATTIAVGFAEAREEMGKYKNKIFVTGIPVRTNLGTIDQVSAKRQFGFAANEVVVFMFGGSQGAQQLNELLLHHLPFFIAEASIIHVTGQDHYQAVVTVAQELINNSPRKEQYKPFPYLSDDMEIALAAADIVVSRAGATTLAELARCHKPALIIPLEHSAANHQIKNAQVFERAGAVFVLEPPANSGKELFKHNLHTLISDPATRQRLAQNIAKLDTPQAGAQIADLALRLGAGFAAAYETGLN